jgi:hypothetical protein
MHIPKSEAYIERWALFMGGLWSPKQGRGPVAIKTRHARRIRGKKYYEVILDDYRGNRMYTDHQGTSQVQGPPVDLRSLQVTCGRMNRLQAATSDACLPRMHT